MAEKLKEFKFQTRGPRKYDWDQWMDGEIWRVSQGQDFDPPPRNFLSSLHNMAKRKGMKVRANVEGNSVVFQFYAA
jgi:hypothetical protein